MDFPVPSITSESFGKKPATWPVLLVAFLHCEEFVCSGTLSAEVAEVRARFVLNLVVCWGGGWGNHVISNLMVWRSQKPSIEGHTSAKEAPIILRVRWLLWVLLLFWRWVCGGGLDGFSLPGNSLFYLFQRLFVTSNDSGIWKGALGLNHLGGNS